MKLVFTYNIEKDIENIIKGAKSVNNKKPTRFYNLLTEKYGDHLNTEKIRAFIEEQDARTIIDMDKEVARIEKRWKIIEPVFINRVEQIFGMSYPPPIITVYVTHNERCTYNIKENYFFVKIDAEFPNNTIPHELLHFYTWHAFGKKTTERGAFRAGI